MLRAVALDIDGTITRPDGTIPPESWGAIHKLEKNGVKVILVSGNAICVLLGLKHYSGATGAAIGENGGVILYNSRIHVLGSRTDFLERARKAVIEELGDVLEESVQNPYRHVDYAFMSRNPGISRRMIAESIEMILKKNGLTSLEVLDSGVAFHIHEIGVNKGAGLEKACELMGINTGDVVAIGDSEVDLTLFEKAGKSVAVGNAIPELKEKADIVLEETYFKGFLRAVDIILTGAGK